MRDYSNGIPASLGALWAKGEVREELYREVVTIARRALAKSAAERGRAPLEGPEDLAAEFLVFMAEGPPLADLWRKSALEREFRRWLTRRNDPHGIELWHILSNALRQLEKEGIVQRTGLHRQRNNSNRTEWCLCRKAGAIGDPVKAEARDGGIPHYGQRRTAGRILKGGEARKLVLAILEAFDGSVSMGEITTVARRHVFLPGREESLDQSPTGEEHDDSLGMHESLELEESYAIDGLIGFEVASRARGIWDALARVSRGATRIEATRVLCCYFLPKRVGDQNVVLESIGPASTVDDIVHRDIVPTLKEHLHWERTGLEPSQKYEQWAFRKVVRGVL